MNTDKWTESKWDDFARIIEYVLSDEFYPLEDDDRTIINNYFNRQIPLSKYVS